MIGKGVHRKQSTIKHNTIFKVHIIMMSNIEDWGTFIITHLKRLNLFVVMQYNTVYNNDFQSHIIKIPVIGI